MDWLDSFRGLAVLGMIWVHAANTFLLTRLVETEAYAEWSFYHGLVAPAFFWITGYVRGRFVDRFRSRPMGRTAVHWLVILLIGYGMHLPVGPLLGGAMTEADWRMLWRVDVLQCLAVTGLGLLLLERLPGRWPARLLALGLAVGFVLATVQAPRWGSGWLPVDAWLTTETGSLFPLFPWVGFGLTGFVCGGWTSQPGRPATRRHAVVLGGLGLAFAMVVPRSAWPPEPLNFFLVRLGWVMLLASATILLLQPLLRKVKERGLIWRDWLPLAGRESLLVYVLHLAIIHVLPLRGGTLEQKYGGSQSPGRVVGWFVLLSVLCLLAARGNEWRKARDRRKREARERARESSSVS